MALLTRVKSPDWNDGDVLTASDLKAEFNNIINGLNGAADISVVDCTIADDLTVGDDAAISGDLSVAGSVTFAGNLVAPLPAPGYISNLGLSFSANVLTLVGANGAALSSTNKGFIAMPGVTAGTVVVLPVNTAAFTLRDDNHASSDFTNLEWGVTAGTNWANDIPFFLYAVNRGDAAFDGTDGNSAIAIARNPKLATTSASALNLGTTAAIPATDDKQAMILLGDSYTIANYTSKPCQLIGAIRMRYATATADWTIQALSDNDGLGARQLEKTFATTWTMPLAQSGAATGTFLLDNAGTAPVFTTNGYVWRLDRDGSVRCGIGLSGDGGTDGSGAVAVYIALPLTSSAAEKIEYPMGTIASATTLSGGTIGIGTIATTENKCSFSYLSGAATQTPLTLSMFSNGGRSMFLRIEYPGF